MVSRVVVGVVVYELVYGKGYLTIGFSREYEEMNTTSIVVNFGANYANFHPIIEKY